MNASPLRANLMLAIMQRAMSAPEAELDSLLKARVSKESAEPFCAMQDVAAHLQMDRSTLYRLKVNERCAHVLGGIARYRMSEVICYLKNLPAEQPEERHVRPRKS